VNLNSDGLPAVTVTVLAAFAADGSATPTAPTETHINNIAIRLFVSM
jgi:hypothetical protein